MPGPRARFPDAPPHAGMYESFYLRAFAPDRPLGVWIRYTVHRRAGQALRGSVWLTLFEGSRRPYQHKLTTPELAAPPGEWIAVGDSLLGPGRARGACGDARWSLRFACQEPLLSHLPHPFMYRAPLPRTKLTSPAPDARFEGTLELSGPSPPGAGTIEPATRTIELDGWRGMVGHNWGTEHAERWIWLHGVGFREEPRAWLDLALGRVRLAGLTTPWVANGALRLAEERHRLGGLGARGLLVAERPSRCLLSLPGAGGLTLEAHVQTPPEALAGWRYADPDGTGHYVSNCSIAALTLTVRRPGRPARTLRTAHGAAYELGMCEQDHGVPIAPFPDG